VCRKLQKDAQQEEKSSSRCLAAVCGNPTRQRRIEMRSSRLIVASGSLHVRRYRTSRSSAGSSFRLGVWSLCLDNRSAESMARIALGHRIGSSCEVPKEEESRHSCVVARRRRETCTGCSESCAAGFARQQLYLQGRRASQLGCCAGIIVRRRVAFHWTTSTTRRSVALASVPRATCTT